MELVVTLSIIFLSLSLIFCTTVMIYFLSKVFQIDLFPQSLNKSNTKDKLNDDSLSLDRFTPKKGSPPTIKIIDDSDKIDTIEK